MNDNTAIQLCSYAIKYKQHTGDKIIQAVAHSNLDLFSYSGLPKFLSLLH
jgi:hypothetical protein